nr:GntR family transcriptional regulator [Oceanobacillus sp. AG]
MEQLIYKINKGDYREHDRLPSERELCDISIRKALGT